jgi:hypothetical protein
MPITLTGTDDLGSALSLTTTSDSIGTYGFAHTSSWGADSYVVTFGLVSGFSGFTARAAAGQEQVDSNADATGAPPYSSSPTRPTSRSTSATWRRGRCRSSPTSPAPEAEAAAARTGTVTAENSC